MRNIRSQSHILEAQLMILKKFQIGQGERWVR